MRFFRVICFSSKKLHESKKRELHEKTCNVGVELHNRDPINWESFLYRLNRVNIGHFLDFLQH